MLIHIENEIREMVLFVYGKKKKSLVIVDIGNKFQSPYWNPGVR